MQMKFRTFKTNKLSNDNLLKNHKNQNSQELHNEEMMFVK